jgi:RES domain-containing protein
MPEAWRMVRAKHAESAFTGEGAAKSGGRWNSRGVAVIYASNSRALAALETLVHLTPPVLFEYRIFRIEFDEGLVERPEIFALPKDWRAEPPPPSTKMIGDAWARESRSVAIAFPSVIIPDEINYVLNPAHPDFKRIVIGPPVEFSFDRRLLV